MTAIVTIGNFDGVHLGHQVLLRQMVDRAKVLGLRSFAVTFDPHPERVLVPNRRLLTLTDAAEKESLIRATGIDPPTPNHRLTRPATRSNSERSGTGTLTGGSAVTRSISASSHGKLCRQSVTIAVSFVNRNAFARARNGSRKCKRMLPNVHTSTGPIAAGNS